MKLSNSLIRSVKTQRCQYYIKLQLDGVRSDPTLQMKKGLVFEDELLGSTMTGEEVHLPLLKSGEYSKPEKDIRARANEIKAMFPEMKFDVQKVQYFVENGQFKAHPDCEVLIDGELFIVDVKFSQTKISDSFIGWANLEEKLNDHEWQYLIYSIIHKEIHGSYPKFAYLICSMSWIRLIKVEFSQEQLDYFMNVAKHVSEKIEAMNGKPIGDYNTCQSCLLLSKCDKATKVPNMETVFMD